MLTALFLLACQEKEPSPTPDITIEASTEEVTFSSDDFVLEGTLYLPQHSSTERVPGVVLAHGSGPQSRLGENSGQLSMSYGFSIRTYEAIAVGLQNAGYAVLTYDKRTCGSANGCNNAYSIDYDATVHDFLADASAALDWLSEQEEIDPNGLIAAGHSQGGSFVPLLMEERGDLAAGLILAGGYRPIDQLLAYQLEFTSDVLEHLNYSEAQIQSATASLSSLVTGVQELRAGEFDGTSIAGASVEFWQSWLDVSDEAPLAIANIERPIFAVSGSFDWNVPAQETESWGTLFQQYPDIGHEAKVLDCLSHSFNCISGQGFEVTGFDDEVSSDIIDELTRFLDANIP